MNDKPKRKVLGPPYLPGYAAAGQLQTLDPRHQALLEKADQPAIDAILRRIEAVLERLRQKRSRLGKGDDSPERTLMELYKRTGVDVLTLREMPMYEFYQYVEAAIRMDEAEPKNEVQKIADALGGNKGKLFAFVARRASGVSLTSITEYVHPETGDRLTSSTNLHSLASMLKRISGDVSKYGWQIRVSVANDKAIASRRKFSE